MNIIPKKNDHEFIDFCYKFFFHRDPDDEGKNFYLNMISQGHKREEILHSFIESSEFLNFANNNKASNPCEAYAPYGHFYSALPHHDDIKHCFDKASLNDYIINKEYSSKQIELANEFIKYYHEINFTKNKPEKWRYTFENGSFNYFDGIILYCMIRHTRPQRIIEVGSGYSSALMIDTCEFFLKNKTELTFIEPFPNLLRSLIHKKDKQTIEIIEKKVQNVPLEIFQELKANDILFIDSSHVSKFGSDVNHIVFKVIPNLQPGVIIHFHDIFKNFDYPKEWLLEGRAWNEAYLIRALIENNPNFTIVFFNDWFASKHWDFLVKNMPICTTQPKGSPFKNSGVSLWIRKNK